MELSREDIVTILNTVQESGYRYFSLEIGDLKMTMGESASSGPAREAVSPPAVTASDGRKPIDRTEPAKNASQSGVQEPGTPDSSALNRHVLTAPVVGVFYDSPSPDDPPYVSVGDHVQEGDTVGLIEVMKVYNSVASDVTGTVVELLAENNGAVEYGQPLLVIERDDA